MQKIPKGKHEDKISIVDYEEMISMVNMMIRCQWLCKKKGF